MTTLFMLLRKNPLRNVQNVHVNPAVSDHPLLFALLSHELSVPHLFITGLSFMLCSDFLFWFPSELLETSGTGGFFNTVLSVLYLSSLSLSFSSVSLSLSLSLFSSDQVIQEMALIASWGNYTHFLSVCLPICHPPLPQLSPPLLLLCSGASERSRWRSSGAGRNPPVTANEAGVRWESQINSSTNTASYSH